MKERSILLALLALAGTACDDDDGTSDRGNDAGSDSAVADAGEFASCQRDQIASFPDYTGEPVWTEQQQMSCALACGMSPEAESEACIAANCPGFELFNQCVDGVLLSCLTTDDEEGACRTEWETFNCCVEDRCSEVPATEQDGCLNERCQPQLEDVNACLEENGDPNAQPPHPCIQRVVNRCIQQDAASSRDAGVMMPGTTDRENLLFVRQRNRRIDAFWWVR
jgi:hypothetical protein